MANVAGPGGQNGPSQSILTPKLVLHCSGEVQSGQNVRMSGSDTPVGPRLANGESGQQQQPAPARVRRAEYIEHRAGCLLFGGLFGSGGCAVSA
jgi:hypothetical protein